MASKGFLFYLLCVLPVVTAHNTNGTVNGSVVFSCVLKTSGPIDPAKLRFYWEDVKTSSVLYFFDRGKDIPEHTSKTYQSRTTASVQDMRSGNISVTLNNLTLEDDRSSFWAFAVLFDEHDPSLHEQFKICQTTLHVAVPYQEPDLTVNEDKTAATCRTQGGFPEPVLTWRGYNIFDNTDHPLQPKERPTIDQQGGLYIITSTITLTGYHSLTCLITNPTSNVTWSVSVTDVGLKLSGWVIALIVVGVVVLLAVLIAVYVMWKIYVGQQDLSGWVIAGIVVGVVGLIAVVLIEVYVIWKKHVEQQDLPGWATGGLVVVVVLLAAAVLIDVYIIWKKHVGQPGPSGGDIIGLVVRGVRPVAVVLLAAGLTEVYVFWKKYAGQQNLSGWATAGFGVGVVLLILAVITEVCVIWKKYAGQQDLSGWAIAGIVLGGGLLPVLFAVYVFWKKHVKLQDLSGGDIALIVVGVVLLAAVLLAAVLIPVYVIWKKRRNRNQRRRDAAVRDSAATRDNQGSDTAKGSVAKVLLQPRTSKI